jgi:hypothetical protein
MASAAYNQKDRIGVVVGYEPGQGKIVGSKRSHLSSLWKHRPPTATPPPPRDAITVGPDVLTFAKSLEERRCPSPRTVNQVMPPKRDIGVDTAASAGAGLLDLINGGIETVEQFGREFKKEFGKQNKILDETDNPSVVYISKSQQHQPHQDVRKPTLGR